jgi:hypothetical protein
MKQFEPMLADKARAEVVGKARAKRSRSAAARKGKESARQAADGSGASEVGLTGAVKEMAQSAVTTVEGLVKTVSGKIKEMVSESLSAPASRQCSSTNPGAVRRQNRRAGKL